MAEKPIDEELYETVTVPELRDFCSENDVTRSRGSSKAETVVAAVKQAPDAVHEYLGRERPGPVFTGMCSCGHEAEFDDADEAVSAIESHAGSCDGADGGGRTGGASVWADDGRMLWSAREGRIELAG